MSESDSAHQRGPGFAARTDWQLVPNALTRRVEERRRRGLPILDLTESNPTRVGFAPDETLLKALEDPRALTYEPDPRGPLTAREAVSDYYAARGTRVAPEQIFLTTGTSESYSYVFRLLADAGDNILIPRPSYPLFDFLAGLNDLEVVPYPLRYDHHWRIDLDIMRHLVGGRFRAIVVVHPNNPTGSLINPEERSFLIDCCRGSDAALIADEVFSDYAFAPVSRNVATHASVSEVLTFTLSGLSKISALPQMKLGWIVASGLKNHLETALERLEVIADTYLSVSAPLAYALPALLARAETIQPQLMERLRANIRRLDEAIGSSPDLSRLEIEGGWYAILKVPPMMSDEDWTLEFLEKDGVLVHPGHFYDFPEEGFLVLSLLPEEEIFREATARILARVVKSR